MLFTLFTWWLVLTLLGLAGWGLLLALRVRRGAPLWAWARPVGLLFLTWLAWLLGHLLAMPLALWLALAATGLLGSWGLWRGRSGVRQALSTDWHALLLGEVVLLVMAAWVVWARGREPGIVHTEQPMDIAFLASCARASRMPPADPWLAGEALNYYYLGYLVWGLLARLADTAPTIAYNLALAATAGLAAQALYGLLLAALPSDELLARWKRLAMAALGAGVVLSAGNLIVLAEALHSWGALPDGVAAWLGVPGLAEASVTGSLIPDGSWWWRASRPWLDTTLLRDPTVIAEFPAFSLALGDLHPHLMALPWSVSAVGLALTAQSTKGRWLRAAFLGWLIGGAAFINGWELPALLGLAALWQVRQARCGLAGWAHAGALWLVTLAGAIAPYALFWLGLSTQVTGLQVNWLAKTPLRGYLLVFGAWLLPLVGLLLGTPAWWRGSGRGRLWRWWLGVLVASVVIIWLVGGAAQVALSALGLLRGALLALLLALALAWLAERFWRLAATTAARPLLLALLGLGLTYGTELLFLGDLFGTRMNTLFKFYYQAWWLLGTVAVVALARLCDAGHWQRGVATVTGLLWALLCTYPLLTMPPRPERWTLDAVADLTPAEADAVVWLGQQAEPGDVLLAAPGVTYAPASVRLSSLTGVPMLLGWPDHERQWGRSGPLLAEREGDVDQAYLTADGELLAALLQRYGVRWVALGPQERQRYGDQALAIERWAPWCGPVFERGGLILLACHP